MKLTMRNPNFQTVSQNSASIRSYCPKTVQKRFSSIYGFKIFTRMPKKRSEIILMSNKHCLISSPKKYLKKLYFFVY